MLYFVKMTHTQTMKYWPKTFQTCAFLTSVSNAIEWMASNGFDGTVSLSSVHNPGHVRLINLVTGIRHHLEGGVGVEQGGLGHLPSSTG